MDRIACYAEEPIREMMMRVTQFQSKPAFNHVQVLLLDKKSDVSVGGGELQSAGHQCGTELLQLANRENHTCSSAESRNQNRENTPALLQS